MGGWLCELTLGFGPDMRNRNRYPTGIWRAAILARRVGGHQVTCTITFMGKSSVCTAKKVRLCYSRLRVTSAWDGLPVRDCLRGRVIMTIYLYCCSENCYKEKISICVWKKALGGLGPPSTL